MKTPLCQKMNSVASACARAVFLALAALAFAAGLPAAETAIYGTYASWPSDSDWVAVPSLNDPVDAVPSGDEVRDFVGNATYPGFYKYYNKTSGYLFFRMRLHAATINPATVGGTYWIYIDSNLDALIDYAIAWDAQNQAQVAKHGLEMMVKSVQGPTWSVVRCDDRDGKDAAKDAPPDFAYGGTDGYIREIDGVSTTDFGTTTFLDFAVKCSYLTTNTSLACNQTWRLQLGSGPNRNDHNVPSTDIAGGKGLGDSSTDSGNWSDGTALLVEMGSLTARPVRGGILVEWATESERHSAGFHVWRAPAGTGEFTRITGELVPAAGSELEGRAYAYLDGEALPGEAYCYRVEEIDESGAGTLYGPACSEAGEPVGPPPFRDRSRLDQRITREHGRHAEPAGLPASRLH